MKIVINGETFEYDGAKQPMSEALAIEGAYKRRYVQWQEDLAAGSMEAYCVLVWVIWRRDGRSVPYEDIIEGRADFDLNELLQSMLEAAAAAKPGGAEGSEPDPTGPPAPDGTPGTPNDTKASSAST